MVVPEAAVSGETFWEGPLALARAIMADQKPQADIPARVAKLRDQLKLLADYL